MSIKSQKNIFLAEKYLKKKLNLRYKKIYKYSIFKRYKRKAMLMIYSNDNPRAVLAMEIERTANYGEYGIDDVCLSLLNVVGDKGAHAKIMLPLNDKELEALHNSAKVLKDLIGSLNI